MQISAHECYPSTCQNKDATDNTLRTETPCLFIMERIFFFPSPYTYIHIKYINNNKYRNYYSLYLEIHSKTPTRS